ncbi:MAG: glutathione S-transferase N-terminal domain-containing protein [Desulfopila sp.]
MIQLYLWASCPFCQKVEKAATRLGLVAGKDFTRIESAPGTPGMEQVARIGGKSMVPFLLDGDTWMYESDDIVDYLQSRK